MNGRFVKRGLVGSGVRLAAAAIVATGLAASSAQAETAAPASASAPDAAQDEVDAGLNEAGRVWYDRYCTPCHGAGGAPGTAVNPRTKKPVDLRTYVADNGGRFPAGAWLAAISGPNPRRTHAQVWERIRREQRSTGSNNAAARGVVSAIARYIISVQKK